MVMFYKRVPSFTAVLVLELVGSVGLGLPLTVTIRVSVMVSVRASVK